MGDQETDLCSSRSGRRSRRPLERSESNPTLLISHHPLVLVANLILTFQRALVQTGIIPVSFWSHVYLALARLLTGTLDGDSELYPGGG